MKTIENTNFRGKKVLVRVDFNVPFDTFGKISDDTRIREALPTINKLINDQAAVILVAHLGRPKKGGFEKEFTLRPVAEYLSSLLNKNVVFTQSLFGENIQNGEDEISRLAKNLKNGEVMLLENIRFYPEETKGGEDLAQKLAKLSDCYVNDAFGAAHRAHSSTAIVAKYFPNDKYFGLLMQSEIENLERLLKNPQRPFTAIIGGSKVSSKIGVLENLMDKVDYLLIGGGMLYTFFKALGHNIGSSLCEDDKIETAKQIIEKAKQKQVKLLLAQDNIITDRFANDAKPQNTDSIDIPDGFMGMDIGEKTIQEYEKIIRQSQTILWNGPMGVFEFENFARGTNAIAHTIAQTTEANHAFSAIGGGDSVAAIKKSGFADKISYISTGGGAMLEYIEGKKLPGIEAILN